MSDRREPVAAQRATRNMLGSVVWEHLLEDPEIFSQFYQTTDRNIYCYTMALNGSVTGLAEDMTAEAYLRAWKKRRSFSGDDGAAFGWLLAIAKHLLIDRFRTASTHPLEADLTNRIAENHTSAQTVHAEAALMDQQLVGHVIETFLGLPENQREMVPLTFMPRSQLPGNDPTLTEMKMIMITEALQNDYILFMVTPDTNNARHHGQRPASRLRDWRMGKRRHDRQSHLSNDYLLQNVYWQIDSVHINLNTDDAQVSQANLIEMADSTHQVHFLRASLYS
jgi:RNA polymerase sigma factor (sigma-70 family)